MIKKPKVAFAFMIFFLFASFNVAAFSARKCGKTFSGKGGGVNGQIFWGLSETSTSLGQFISSTGVCSAIGMNTEERAKSFYAFNSDKVLEDIARGRGEYFLSLADLWGCPKDESLEKVTPLRSSYYNLLNLGEERQYEFIKERMSCRNDKDLFRH